MIASPAHDTDDGERWYETGLISLIAVLLIILVPAGLVEMLQFLWAVVRCTGRALRWAWRGAVRGAFRSGERLSDLRDTLQPVPRPDARRMAHEAALQRVRED